MAHTGVGHTDGFMFGFTHPLFGLDHVLAMVAVGLWAVQRGGRAVWAVPVSFVVMMALGGVLGVTGMDLPAVELGIAGSIVVFGLLILFAARLPLAVGLVLTGVFAVFHGHAHGAELAPGVSAFGYGVGFITATVLLHLAGMAAAYCARSDVGGTLLRAGGGAIAAAGTVVLAGLW
jgi:urease accessory protein